MRQFIKEHPWRLEIVPGLAVIFAAIAPLIDYGQFPRAVYPTLCWWLTYTLRLLFMLSVAGFLVWNNHCWVSFEKNKKFNVFPPIFTFIITAFATPLIPILVLGPRHYRPCSHTAAGLLIAVTLMVGAVEALIEKTRPHRLRTTSEEVTAKSPEHVEVKPGESFYYRELASAWWRTIICCILIVLFIGFGMWWTDGKLANSTILVLVAAVVFVIVYGCRYGFVITNSRLEARVGITKLSIPMDSITDFAVRPYDFQDAVDGPLIIRSGMPLPDLYLVPPQATGPCLRIQTASGQGYVLGMKNPEIACKLIQTALAAREQSEGQV